MAIPSILSLNHSHTDQQKKIVNGGIVEKVTAISSRPHTQNKKSLKKKLVEMKN